MAKTRSQDYEGEEEQPLATQPPEVEEDTEEEEEEQEEEEVEEEEDENEEEESPAEVKFTPNDEALESIADMIELYVEKVFANRKHRMQYFEALQYYVSIHPLGNIGFGRLQTLYDMAEILTTVCSKEAYASFTEDEDALASMTCVPLVEWNREKWIEMRQGLAGILDLCLRKDVKHRLVLQMEGMDIKKNFRDTTHDPKRAKKKDLFQDKFKWIENRCLLHEVLAPIRQRIEAALGGTSTKISKKNVRDVLNYKDALDNEFVSSGINKLFRKENPQPSQKVEFKQSDELIKIMESVDYDLQYFQAEFEMALQEWKREICPFKSALVQLGYRMPNIVRQERSPQPVMAITSPSRNSAATRAELDELKKGRAALKRGHGEDPLEESRRLAKTAKRSNIVEGDDVVPLAAEDAEEDDGMLSKKKSATTIRFEEPEELRSPVRLGSTPVHRRNSSPFPKTYRGPLPDEGVFQSDGRVIKKRRWTVEEKNAVKFGVKRFGVGKWVQIKTEHDMILRNRTAVQIKDCWRTMVRKKEVTLQELVSEEELEREANDEEEEKEEEEGREEEV